MKKTKSDKTKLFQLDATFKAKESEDGSIKISGYASTADTDRVGDVILPDAWTKNGGIDNFTKNPIILFNHNYDKPIGKATAITVDGKGLHLEADISNADPEIQKLIKDGVLSTFSVGFSVRDADYIQETNGLLIKEAELYETSVVSVPCNQDATFSLAKSFDDVEEYEEFKKQFTKTAEPTAEELAIAKKAADAELENARIEALKQENKMDPEELAALLKAAAEEGATAAVKQLAIDAKAKADLEEEARKSQAAIVTQMKTASETLMADIEKRFSEKNESLETVIAELREDLTSKAGEIEAMRQSKRHFSDRNGNDTGDWKKELGQALTDAKILGLVTGKGWDTAKGIEVRKAVSVISGVEVSSEAYEQVVSTNLQRDIELELILAPLFRELPMTSNTMLLPIMPDSGYAEFVARGTNGTQTPPKGNLDQRSAAYGDNAGVDLGERAVTTHKLMSTSYLGNDTEEDAILPILGLIREAMVRSHARSIEQSLLLGNDTLSQGIYTGIFDGLTEMAIDATTNGNLGASGYAAGDAITAKDLFNMRKSMGKYGQKPTDIVYIVSLDAYYNLIEDVEFEDVNLVGALATKVKGSVGRVYGSQVIVCDEFVAPGAAKYAAVCVNVRNYLVPRLRNLTMESEYSVKDQQRVLVASQRVGFIDIIEDATSVSSLQYKLT